MENREIKFRAWNDVKKRMEHDVYKEYRNLMQYTGLKDKNGVEIYEGDILSGNPGIPCEVNWDANNACFIALSSNKRICIITSSFNEREIIGNIYENPELSDKQD